MPHAIADEVKIDPKKPNYADRLPAGSRERLENAGIDLNVYPSWPERPTDVKLAASVRAGVREHVDPGARADKAQRALLGAPGVVATDLSVSIGTEIGGIQLSQLTDQQKDELALLIGERTVVVFRDQDLTPQAQRDLGAYFGEVEVHPTAAQVPGLPGVSIIWDELDPQKAAGQLGFRNAFGTQDWHTDLTHEKQPPGITHLHNDVVPPVGGDTFWASGYSAYDHLSPLFRAKIENLKGVYRSAHAYPSDPNDPASPKVHIEREHPLVRTHPGTGFVNRKYTTRIAGLEPAESKLLLEYLFDVYEKSLDCQIRVKWTPRMSVLWDNRISIHAACYDHEGKHPRHGTRVSSLAEVPYLDPSAPSRREALGLVKEGEYEEVGQRREVAY
ncbi:hypothetical protein JCM8547_000906 [Rhodosporidiobolus lusitaniae]